MSPNYSTIEKERESLETHVELCAQRYGQLDARIANLEAKIDSFSGKIDAIKADIVKNLIVTSGSVIVALIGAAAVIISHIR